MHARRDPSLKNSILSFARVLIATDDDAVAALLNENLREWGFVPHRVSDGDAALVLLTEGDAPRIAILDADLPLIPGMGVAAAVRNRGGRRTVWTILLDGDVDGETIANARDAGVDDLLLKPVDVGELRVRVSVAERVQSLMSEVHSQQQIAHFHAEHDALTGLWNRDTVLRMLFAETDRVQRLKAPMALVLIDLDHFARVNSDYGYGAGDKILKELTKRLRRFLRSYDVLGRSGEDEFLVALPGCTSSEALTLAQRVKRSILNRPFAVGRELLTVTASLGISHSEGRSPLVVLREAERALFQAKLAGRNCEKVFLQEDVKAAAVASPTPASVPVNGGMRLVETLKA